MDYMEEKPEEWVVMSRWVKDGINHDLIVKHWEDALRFDLSERQEHLA